MYAFQRAPPLSFTVNSQMPTVPYPDLSRTLSLDDNNIEGASDMASWEPQFGDDGDQAALHIMLTCAIVKWSLPAPSRRTGALVS